MRWSRIVLALALWSLSATCANAQTSNTWASAEALLWWTNNGPAPIPLATTEPNGSMSAFPGALGNPDTTVVLGDSGISFPMQVGGRFTLGHWFTTAPAYGLEANYLFLGITNESRTVADDGTLFLTNPFYDSFPMANVDVANYLAVPGFFNPGSATLATSTELQGAELNALALLSANDGTAWTLLGGYRFLTVSEDFVFATTQADSISFFPGQFLDTYDQFQTRNYFHGGQVGLRCQVNRGIWFFESTAKVALGSLHQVLHVRGSTTTNTGPGFNNQIPVTTVPGGIYAQPTNIGDYGDDVFAVLPELALRLGLNLGPHARFYVGYNFLFLNAAARPGNQIDGSINASQLVSFTGVPAGPLVGPARPAVTQIESSDFWAQGINFGLEFLW